MDESEPSSSSSTTSESLPRPITIPRNRRENRTLKEGLIEPNYVDLSYVQLPVIVPSIIFATLSLLSFIAAIYLAYKEDVIPTDDQMRRGVILSYGSIRIACNSTIPFPINGLPSVLMLLERNSLGNIMFRIAVVIPIVLRIFQSLSMRHMVRAKQHCGVVFEVTSDMMPALTAVECFSMALFSIMTIHSDFPIANRFAKLSFAISSALNMLSTTIIIFNFRSKSKDPLEITSLALKMVCSFIFCYLSPQYFQFHHTATMQPMCHSYIPRIYAMIEYVLITAYAIFHLTWIVDIRNIHFICYPRSCSGECEPLDPSNFMKGGKYMHCRAFEERQWQIRREDEEEGYSHKRF